MKKINIIISMCLLVTCLSLTSTHAKDLELEKKRELELVITKFEQINADEIVVQYSVINRRDYNRNNVSIAFKVIEEDIPVGCKEIKTMIPKGSDETDIKETKIAITGNGENIKLRSALFYITKRYRIEEFFSDCKEF